MWELNADVVIGANYGDEGKGLVTDYLCRQYPSNETVINVRFNGTSQAGHTVQFGEHRHVFSHFGAGSFNPNVITFLTEDFYINPIAANAERKVLERITKQNELLVVKKAPFVLPWDIMLNQAREKYRQSSTRNHGSCGCGLWEAVQRSKDKHFVFNGFSDYFMNRTRGVIDRILTYEMQQVLQFIRDNYYDDVVIDMLSEKGYLDRELFYAQSTVDKYIEEVVEMSKYIKTVTPYNLVREYKNFVFEGAQGLLLDEDNIREYPHVTASKTGTHNVEEFFDKAGVEIGEVDFNLYYVTRPYLTRHGAGPMPTECPVSLLEREFDMKIYDHTNVYDEFQEEFRYGELDINSLIGRISRDRRLYGMDEPENVTLVVTHAQTLTEKQMEKFSLGAGSTMFSCSKDGMEWKYWLRD